MKGTRAALRYAKATLSLAKDKGLADKVNSDLLLINKTVSENSDLMKCCTIQSLSHLQKS